MASMGGWVRLFVGLLLSIEVVKVWLFGGEISIYGNMLAVAFIFLTALYFLIRF